MPKRLVSMIAVLVVVVAAFAVAPHLYSNQLLLFNFVVYLVLAQGLNVIYGFTGYLPFGYVGFFGAGAYGFSLAVIHWHTSPFLALAVGVAVALILGVMLTPLLRLSGAYFAVANLAAAQAVLQVVSNPNLTDFTRGPYGISLESIYNPRLSYDAAVVTLACSLAVVIYLKSSRLGLGLEAIREDPISAAMAGVNVVSGRVIAWLLSALIAGLIGGIFAWYVSVFYPETVFDLGISIFAIVFTLFGGTATLIGPILGVLILYGIYNVIGITAPAYFQLIYGLLIVLLVLFLPNGIVSLFNRRGRRVP